MNLNITPLHGVLRPMSPLLIIGYTPAGLNTIIYYKSQYNRPTKTRREQKPFPKTIKFPPTCTGGNFSFLLGSINMFFIHPSASSTLDPRGNPNSRFLFFSDLARGPCPPPGDALRPLWLHGCHRVCLFIVAS